QRLAIIPESHTKNTFYLDNLVYLAQCLADAGFEVRLLSLDAALFSGGDQLELVSHSGQLVTYEKAIVADGLIKTVVGNYIPEIAVLNNDQSSPLDVNWGELKIPVVPS